MADEFIFFSRKDLTPEDIYGSGQLDQITTRYFPWVYSTAAHSLGWQWWGVHLLEQWSDLPNLIAPPAYDSKYYSLKEQDRIDWLTALRWVCTGVFDGAIMRDFDADDEYNPLVVNLSESFNEIKEDLYAEVMQGLNKLNAWLSWREQSPVKQILTALPIVQLRVQGEEIAVVQSEPEAENQFFYALFNEFQLYLSTSLILDIGMRIMHNRLLTLGSLVLPPILTSVAALPATLPSVQWINLSEMPMLPLSRTFRHDLEAVLTIRIEWADKASKLIGNALNISAPSVQDKDLPSKEFTLKQVAMINYYNNRSITDTNKSEIAASAGFTGTTSGQHLMDRYAEWSEQVVSELPESRRQLTAIRKDLVAILSKLNDKASGEAHRMLKKLAKKYKGGF